MRPHPGALTEGPIVRTLVMFTLPILLGSVLQTLNGSVNAIWVGRFLGPVALTATANANTLLFLLIGAVFGLTMAATILVGQHYGAQRQDEARRVVGTSATFFTLLAVGICIVGWLLAERLLHWMRTPAEAVPLAVAYLRIIFVALPFMYLYTFAMAVLRGAGDSKTPFKFLVLQVALDIVLNPVLIFGFGPIPALGIAGSATATLIASAVSLAALLAHLYRRNHELCLRGPDLALLRVDRAILGTLVRKGVPMGLQMLVISGSAIAMIVLVNRFGTDTTAAYGAAWQLWNYVQLPAFAIGAAVSSMAAQNVGANRWDRVGRTAKVGVALSVGMTAALVVPTVLLDRWMLGLFLAPGPALDTAVHLHAIGSWSFVLFAVSMVLFGVVRSTGAVVPPLVALFFALWVVRFPFAALLLPHWGADAIWWSFNLSAAVVAAVSIGYYRWGGWREARMGPGRGAGPGATSAAAAEPVA
jgi:putative MATE family efflux protein